ncbi:hypothetical protein F511_08711 [Dorcoceras hygrometricum]|uniref:Uncharacterized protein n=1 Tax=Dorcoceras hygrometricum TaxID=472368 RepID=A0A2Z7BR17_9LAMI|nr:hypothetical protein F511_08711 [Dorcoceras hygrometricum]
MCCILLCYLCCICSVLLDPVEFFRRCRLYIVVEEASGGRPDIQGAQSSQSQSTYQPQQQQQPQVALQSGRQRFRPQGQQFKKKSGSGSSGSGSSSSSGSRTEFCGFCGGKHPSTHCVACTRRPDEIGADGFSSSRLAGMISGEAAAGAAA